MAIKIVYKQGHSAPEQQVKVFHFAASRHVRAHTHIPSTKNAIHSAIMELEAAITHRAVCVCVCVSFKSQFIGVREKRPEHKNVFRHLTFFRLVPLPLLRQYCEKLQMDETPRNERKSIW